MRSTRAKPNNSNNNNNNNNNKNNKSGKKGKDNDNIEEKKKLRNCVVWKGNDDESVVREHLKDFTPLEIIPVRKQVK